MNGPMPFPMMYPMPVPQQVPTSQAVRGQPSVIQAAFDYIRLCEEISGPERIILTHRGNMDQVDSEVREFQGRELENMEEKTRMAALALLRKYFDGTLLSELPPEKKEQLMGVDKGDSKGDEDGGVLVLLTPDGPVPVTGVKPPSNPTGGTQDGGKGQKM